MIRRPGWTLTEDDVKRFALANARAYQHRRFIWFVDVLLLASTNEIHSVALHRIAEDRVAKRQPSS